MVYLPCQAWRKNLPDLNSGGVFSWISIVWNIPVCAVPCRAAPPCISSCSNVWNIPVPPHTPWAQTYMHTPCTHPPAQPPADPFVSQYQYVMIVSLDHTDNLCRHYSDLGCFSNNRYVTSLYQPPVAPPLLPPFSPHQDADVQEACGVDAVMQVKFLWLGVKVHCSTLVIITTY